MQYVSYSHDKSQVYGPCSDVHLTLQNQHPRRKLEINDTSGQNEIQAIASFFFFLHENKSFRYTMESLWQGDYNEYHSMYL